MQAIQITSFGPPEVLELVELPTPDPGPGQILIRVTAVSVNFADVMRRRNDAYPFPTELPFVPGSEVAGTVAALGDGVDGPPPGTRVFAAVGSDGSTGYAQFAIADASGVIPIPDGLDDADASGIVVAGTTAMLVLRDIARLQPGESVLIGGAGGAVGRFAIQLARTFGAGTVVGTASTEQKRKEAIAAGADHAVDSTADDWAADAASTTGSGFDVVLEMSGGQAFADSLSLLAPFGRLVVYGAASGEPAIFGAEAQRRFLYVPSPNQSIHVFNLGLWFGMRPDRAVEALGELIALIAAGEVAVPTGPSFPLADAAEAHRLLESRRSAGKITLDPWSGAATTDHR